MNSVLIGGYVTAALFNGKTGMMVAMLITTILIFAFGIMALRLRTAIVSALNDAANGIVDKFVIPKDAPAASAISGGGGGGGSGSVSGAIDSVGSMAEGAIANVASTTGSAGTSALLGAGAMGVGGSLLYGNMNSHSPIATGDGYSSGASTSYSEGANSENSSNTESGGDSAVQNMQSNEEQSSSEVKNADESVGDTNTTEAAATGDSSVKAGDTGAATGSEQIDGSMMAESSQEQRDKKLGQDVLKSDSLFDSVSSQKTVKEDSVSGPSSGRTAESAIEGDVYHAGDVQNKQGGNDTKFVDANMEGQSGIPGTDGMNGDVGNSYGVYTAENGPQDMRTVAANVSGASLVDVYGKPIPGQPGQSGQGGLGGAAGVGGYGQAGATGYGQTGAAGASGSDVRAVKADVAGVPGQPAVNGYGVSGGIPGQSGQPGMPGYGGAGGAAGAAGYGQMGAAGYGQPGTNGKQTPGYPGQDVRNVKVGDMQGGYNQVGVPGAGGAAGQSGKNGMNPGAGIHQVNASKDGNSPRSYAERMGGPAGVSGMGGRSGDAGRAGAPGVYNAAYRNGSPAGTRGAGSRYGGSPQMQRSYAQYANGQGNNVAGAGGQAGAAGRNGAVSVAYRNGFGGNAGGGRYVSYMPNGGRDGAAGAAGMNGRAGDAGRNGAGGAYRNGSGDVGGNFYVNGSQNQNSYVSHMQQNGGFGMGGVGRQGPAGVTGRDGGGRYAEGPSMHNSYTTYAQQNGVPNGVRGNRNPSGQDSFGRGGKFGSGSDVGGFDMGPAAESFGPAVTPGEPRFDTGGQPGQFGRLSTERPSGVYSRRSQLSEVVDADDGEFI